jgi:prepilin-type processing-associated H-X9-DG protein
LAPYYGNATSLLKCPAFSGFYKQSGYNYFMGSVAYAFDLTSPTGWTPTSVNLRSIMYPSFYVLSGDCNFPTYPSNADLNDNDTNLLFTFSSPTHNNRVNVLFSDWHVKNYKNYSPIDMTFSYDNPSINW